MNSSWISTVAAAFGEERGRGEVNLEMICFTLEIAPIYTPAC